MFHYRDLLVRMNLVTIVAHQRQINLLRSVSILLLVSFEILFFYTYTSNETFDVLLQRVVAKRHPNGKAIGVVPTSWRKILRNMMLNAKFCPRQRRKRSINPLPRHHHPKPTSIPTIATNS